MQFINWINCFVIVTLQRKERCNNIASCVSKSTNAFKNCNALSFHMAKMTSFLRKRWMSRRCATLALLIWFLSRATRREFKRQRRGTAAAPRAAHWKQMDCARFVEENGTLENQMRALSEDWRKRDETIVCPTAQSTGIHGTVTRPVYTGQKSLDSRLPTVRRRSSKVQDKKISRANAPLTFPAMIQAFTEATQLFWIVDYELN